MLHDYSLLGLGLSLLPEKRMRHFCSFLRPTDYVAYGNKLSLSFDCTPDGTPIAKWRPPQECHRFLYIFDCTTSASIFSYTREERRNGTMRWGPGDFIPWSQMFFSVLHNFQFELVKPQYFWTTSVTKLLQRTGWTNEVIYGPKGAQRVSYAKLPQNPPCFVYSS